MIAKLAASTLSAAETPNALDEQAAERGPADARRREADVEQRVPLAQQRSRLQDGVHRAARDAPGREHQHAVDEREQRAPGASKNYLRQQREQEEDERLAEVDRGQHLAQPQLVDPRRQGGRDERGQELRGDEERRRRERIPRLAEDEQRERDEPDVVADRVRRVREKQPPEGRHAQRFQIRSGWARRVSTACHRARPFSRTEIQSANGRPFYCRLRLR